MDMQAVESPRLEDIATDLTRYVERITPWLHPALVTIINDDWQTERRVAVLQAAGRILITEYIDGEPTAPRDGIEALGKYVVEAAKELADTHKPRLTTKEAMAQYTIDHRILETSEA